MISKRKVNIGFPEDITACIKRYKVLVVVFFTFIAGAFRLGMYYEKVVKDREIIEIEIRHSKEFLQQKEQYMNKYLNIREKYLNDGKRHNL